MLFSKVKSNDGSFLHLCIHKPLPHMGNEPLLHGVKENVNEHVPIEHFWSAFTHVLIYKQRKIFKKNHLLLLHNSITMFSLIILNFTIVSTIIGLLL